MEQITGLLNTVIALIPAILQIVGGFAVIATLTPNTADDRILKFILDIVNFLGANIGKAKNGDPS